VGRTSSKVYSEKLRRNPSTFLATKNEPIEKYLLEMIEDT